MSDRQYDFIELQSQARESYSLSDLYDMFNTVCRRYERRLMSKYEYDELKDTISKRMSVLSALKTLIDQVL